MAPTVAPRADGPSQANDLVARLGGIVTRGQGNNEGYSSGTRGVPGGRIGHSFVHPLAGTVSYRTINEILATDRLSGTNPNRMFALGKYHITIPTLREAVSAIRLTGEARMTPDMQKRSFRDFVVQKAGGGVLANLVLNGRGGVDAAQLAAAKEWASIGVPPVSAIGAACVRTCTCPIMNAPGRIRHTTERREHCATSCRSSRRAVRDRLHAHHAPCRDSLCGDARGVFGHGVHVVRSERDRSRSTQGQRRREGRDGERRRRRGPAIVPGRGEGGGASFITRFAHD